MSTICRYNIDMPTSIYTRRRDKNNRNEKQWRMVVDLRACGLTYAQIATLTGVSRQRAHHIIAKALQYATANDDDLARYIKQKMAALLEGE